MEFKKNCYFGGLLLKVYKYDKEVFLFLNIQLSAHKLKIRFFCFVFTEVKLILQRNMRKRDKTCAKATPEEPKREQRMVCLMSEEELRIVDRYLEKYKITNKSRWLRETILMFIHKNMEEDYPTLFGEHDMRR